MESIKEEFLQLIRDKSKTSEDIYNIIFNNHKEFFSTKKILRSYDSWNNSLYQGTIGENDFIVAEPLSSSLEKDNVEMIYDIHKEMIIKFIDLFRSEYEKNPSDQVITAVLTLSNKFLDEFFAGSTKEKKTISEELNNKYDKKNLMRQYFLSSQIGEGKTAVCCERNVTLGNIFQFLGYETYHIAGSLYSKEQEDKTMGEDYIFTLVKYGKEQTKYALLDIFNGVVISNALAGDYDFSNGFLIERYSKVNKKTDVYELKGPLYEMTNEILKTEYYIRGISKKLEISEYRYQNNVEVDKELRIEVIKEEFLRLLNFVGDSQMKDIFKDYYINYINEYCMNRVNAIEQLATKKELLHK